MSVNRISLSKYAASLCLVALETLVFLILSKCAGCIGNVLLYLSRLVLSSNQINFVFEPPPKIKMALLFFLEWNGLV